MVEGCLWFPHVLSVGDYFGTLSQCFVYLHEAGAWPGGVGTLSGHCTSTYLGIAEEVIDPRDTRSSPIGRRSLREVLVGSRDLIPEFHTSLV